MHHFVRTCNILIAFWAAQAAEAECSVSSDQGARTRTVSPVVQADADLVVSMSMVPKLTHVDYKAASQQPACDLGALAAEDSAYELWESDFAGRQRKALPIKKGQPIATVIPALDIMKAIDSAKTSTAAPTEGYMLAVVTKGAFTGWRFYTAMPGIEIIKHDMVEALRGVGIPIFRNGADGKTAIFVPKGLCGERFQTIRRNSNSEKGLKSACSLADEDSQAARSISSSLLACALLDKVGVGQLSQIEALPRRLGDYGPT